MNYTKEDVRHAEELLANDSGLAERIRAFTARTDASFAQVTGFGADAPASLASLLIASARNDVINFMDAHCILTVELQRQALQGGRVLTYQDACRDAYDLLERHGVITPERVRHVGEEIIPRLAKDLGSSLPEKEARIIDFYEARAKLRSRA